MPSGRFNMDDYVDVAERIRMFAERFPEGSLQSELEPSRNAEGEVTGWLCRAFAYRTADDERPGMGHAWEPVPGLTPYTKNTEAMNAETSAWGRAIIALGFPTKKIASANEVRNRQEQAGTGVKAPTSWAKLWEMMGGYDPQVFAWFERGINAVIRLQNPEAVKLTDLEKADKDYVWQKAVGAALRFREAHEPGLVPPPSVDDVRAAFAAVLDGQELALEGEA